MESTSSSAARRLGCIIGHVADGPCEQKIQVLSPCEVHARSQYEKWYTASLNDREAFWAAAAKGIDWVEPYKKVLDESRKPFYKWYAGGKVSVSHNLVDRHPASQTAVIYDSPVTKTIKKYTYGELKAQTSKLAGVIRSLGVQAGDRVIVYMPMIPETLFAMVACVRLGAVHSVVFGGFAGPELATRIDDAKPTAVLAATCGIEVSKVIPYLPMLTSALQSAEHKPRKVLLKQREQCKEKLPSADFVDWDQALARTPSVDNVVVDSNHPLYILYTSGSTGKPKGVLRDSAPYAVSLKWSMEHHSYTKPGETFWAASDLGWVVGHSWIVYGPLLHGCATVLFEGKPVGTPDAGTSFRIISQHKVTGFYTAPTALRAVRKEDPKLELVKKYDISCLRAMYLAGERCDPATSKAYSEALGVPVLDCWWQTETGSHITGFLDDAVGVRPGAAGMRFPGWDVQVLDEAGQPVAPETPGSLAIKLPLPPGSFPTLWNNDKGYLETYMTTFPGYYETGDAGVISKDGYVTVLERTDDVINVAAHRLSTGGIEAVVKAQEGVADAAVVGAADPDKGQVPIALVVLTEQAQKNEAAILETIKQAVRREVGGIASLGGIVAVDQLPKTRSGKVLRKNIRGLADGKKIAVPATIENMAAIDIAAQALKKMGFPRNAE